MYKLDQLEQWIREQVNNADAEGVVLGLSGGIDSSVTANILRNALGEDSVLGVIMPIDSKDQDAIDGKKVAENLDIKYEEIDLTEAWENFCNILDDGTGSKISRGNLKARLRMNVLYYIANEYNLLVSGTANRSEVSIGYATKFGDGACDIAPIAHFYKTDVREIARHELEDVPEEIIEKPPSAGLWEGQTDEDELGMTYETLDHILRDIEENVGLENYDQATPENEYERKVLDYIENSEHKRQSAKTFDRT